MKYRFKVFTILTLISSCAIAGCGLVTKKITKSIFVDVATATSKHDDVDLVSQAVPTFLLLLEGMLESDPDDPDLLTELAKGYFTYGALIELEDPSRAARIYGRAMAFGQRALLQEEKIEPVINAPFQIFSTITKILKPEHVETVFWAASSWGAWISVNADSMAALADLPRVILLMEWVLEQDDSIYNASPHVFLGVYHAALPEMLGGKPRKSLFHFERALEMTERKSATVFVQMAKFYAVQQFDRELYVSLLNQSLNVTTVESPELNLQNEAAKQQARKLLLIADEIF